MYLCPKCGKPATVIIERAPDGSEKVLMWYDKNCAQGKIVDHDSPVSSAVHVVEQALTQMSAEERAAILSQPIKSKFFNRLT